MRGLLDDAYELAVELRDALDEAALSEETALSRRVRELTDAADDLANRIDRQRTNLRGT